MNKIAEDQLFTADPGLGVTQLLTPLYHVCSTIGKLARGHRQVEGGWGDGSRVIRYRSWMTTPRDPIYAGYRYPAELISYAVWLYFRFPLSLRMVEEMLAARGISVTYETIRQWGLKFSR